MKERRVFAWNERRASYPGHGRIDEHREVTHAGNDMFGQSFLCRGQDHRAASWSLPRAGTTAR